MRVLRVVDLASGRVATLYIIFLLCLCACPICSSIRETKNSWKNTRMNELCCLSTWSEQTCAFSTFLSAPNSCSTWVCLWERGREYQKDLFSLSFFFYFFSSLYKSKRHCVLDSSQEYISPYFSLFLSSFSLGCAFPDAKGCCIVSLYGHLVLVYDRYMASTMLFFFFLFLLFLSAPCGCCSPFFLVSFFVCPPSPSDLKNGRIHFQTPF